MPEPTAVPEPTDVPAQEAEATPVPEVVALPGKHVVQNGENLFRIALKYGMTVEAVAQANGITNPALIFVGQELNISGEPGTPAPVPAPAPGTPTTHVVQPGENLFRIALKYNYSQYYLADYNNISNPALIFVGQVIQIP
jgi:LysM repeat protein